MKFKKHFEKVVAKHFPDSHQAMMAAIDQAYASNAKDTAFALNPTNPMDKRLDFSAYFLALIQILEKRDSPFEQIKTICLEVAADYVTPKSRLQKSLKQLPPKLINTPIAPLILNSLDKKVSQRGHEDGFVARIVTDKEETYGFGYGIDIIECGICKLFAKHEKQKYVPILCEVDQITSSLAGLELIRTGTIANGAEKCDFRFRKRQ